MESESAKSIPLEWVPTLSRRYASLAIDGLLCIAVFVVPTALSPTDSTAWRTARVLIAAATVLTYEPICTGRFVTLGQKIAGVRVRRFDNGQKIGVLRAYGRIIVKALLGFISFLIMPFTAGRRAIHDMASGSIVVMANSEAEFSQWAASRLAPATN